MAAAVFGRALVRRPDAAAAAGAVWLSLDDGLRRIDRLLVYGRRMLRCNRGPDANPCSFFTMYPHCDCGESAEKKTSHSASNPGRAYWRCRNRYGRCDFFEWCDGRLGSANPSPAKKARTSF